jgi:hypothetical protein
MRGSLGGVSRGETQRVVLGRSRGHSPPSSIGAPPPGVTPTSFSAPLPILGGRQRSRAVGGGLSMITGSPDNQPNLAVPDRVPPLGDDPLFDQGADQVLGCEGAGTSRRARFARVSCTASSNICAHLRRQEVYLLALRVGSIHICPEGWRCAGGCMCNL